jgi:tetratricopeptide (TPR) repeat protein
MRWTGLALVAIVAVAGCNGDPVTAGRRLVDTDPEKAAALFRDAAAKKAPCFECEAWLGMALERTKDLKGAAEAYERALAMPEAKNRPEPVAARLLNVYEAQFRDIADVAQRTDLARKAAPLEASLNLAKPWANSYLFDLAKKQITALAEAGKSREAAAAVDAAMALYLTADVKKQFANEATEALRTAFVTRMKAPFEKDLAAALERDGFYDAKTSEVVVANRFTIPGKKADPRFDPAASDFATVVRKEACLPLRKTLEDLVARSAAPLGLRKATPADLDWVFAQVFKDSRAGFATHGSTERAPTGESWLCEVRLPVAKFLGELYRFAE